MPPQAVIYVPSNLITKVKEEILRRGYTIEECKNNSQVIKESEERKQELEDIRKRVEKSKQEYEERWTPKNCYLTYANAKRRN